MLLHYLNLKSGILELFPFVHEAVSVGNTSSCNLRCRATYCASVSPGNGSEPCCTVLAAVGAEMDAGSGGGAISFPSTIATNLINKGVKNN